MNLTNRLAFSRRRLLTTAAAIPLVIAGCQPTTTVNVNLPQQVLDDLTSILGALQTAMTGLAGVLPTSLLTKIGQYIQEAEAIFGTISSATNQTQATSLVQQVVTILSSALSALAGQGTALPGWVGTVVTAAETLLPAILAALGIVAAPMATRSVTRSMSVTEARAVLARYRR